MSEQKRRRRRERGGALTEEQQLKLKAKLADSQSRAKQNQLAVRQDRTAKVPLTPAQQRLWTAWQLDPADSVYNLAGTLTFQGQLNKAWVQASFGHLVAKHGILNSRFSVDGGTTVQQLQADNAFTFIDVPNQDDTVQQAFEIADQPFDLTAEPLLRVALLESQGECTLLVVMHHIVTDGTSMQQLFNEFIQAYALLQNQQSLPELIPQADYLDYALWLAQQDQTILLEKQLADWQTALGDDFEPLRLPANSLARQGGNYPITTQSMTLPNKLWQQVQSLTKQHQVTPYLVLLSAFQYLLHRYSDQHDVKVGVPIANRHHAQTHGLIGFFINTQVVRLEVAPQDSFSALLDKAKLFSQFAQANQDLPFEHLLDAIKPPRSTGSHPLFQVMFNYLKRDKGAMDSLQGVTLKDTQALRFSMPFDLQLDVIEEVSGDTTLHLYYANTLYSEAFAKHCLDELAALLSAVSLHPASPLQYLDWYPAHRQQSLESFSNGESAFEWQDSIADIISAQAQKTPDQSALIFAGEHMSYAQFEQRTNQLAHWLIAQGIGAEDQIGVYFDRSFEMVIALIGVMKSGAAYVPLDPNLPADRIEYIAQNSTFKLVLGNRDNQQFNVPYFAWSALAERLETHSGDYPSVTILPQQAAYVIYTSGSTGKPKGVVNHHHALYNRISWQDQAYPIDSQDRVLQKTPYGFDVSVWEFFWPLMRGATLVVAEPEIHKEPRELAELIQAQQVTLLHFVPSMLQAFISEPLAQQCTSIKHIICSGEALPAALQADTLKLLPQLEIHNLYGPTEAAIDVSYYECDGRADKAVPIGKPIAGCELWVLDQQLNLSPIGAVGELYIGGIGLARGYANRPDLSAERFVANPFAHDGSRLYRSGDLVRWSELGELEYLGRTDHQVKIRGLRIELGEIETQLFAQEGVKEAVVVAVSGPNGGARLAAYVSGSSLDEDRLQQGLSDALPDYMVPSSIMILDALPLSSNGKVDRKALPEPKLHTQHAYQAPQGERETLLCQTWQQVLGHSQIGRNDNFFALGGDSILSLQIVSAMRQHGFALSAKQVFEAPTIAQLAEALSELSEEDKIPQVVSGEVPLLPIQHTFFARQPSHIDHWNQAIRLMPPEPIGLAQLNDSVQLLIKHHDSLRLQFQHQGTWQQVYRDYDEANYREVVWYQQTTDCEFDTYLLNAAEQAQASLSIQRGDSLRVLYVHSERRQALILIAHHLVIDGVSWRILVDDLLQGIGLATAGEVLALSHKSHSYQYWAQQLQAYPNAHASEFALWQNQQCDAIDLPNYVADGDATIASAQTLQVKLSESHTQALLSQASRPYRTHIDELLLAALSVALKQWTGSSNAQIFLEGHGREPWQSQLDLSRTVGWFTSLYPVKLSYDDDLAHTIITTKERLRALPNKGIGYGAFKYYGSEAQQHALCTERKPQIEFNYLGQLDANSNVQLANWQMSTDGVGSSIAAQNPLSADIAINGAIQNSQLQLAISYSGAQLLSSDMAEFAQCFEHGLIEVINHCLDAEVRFTPADVPLLTMSQAELDMLPIVQSSVSSIYPLSAMQQGMMFHSMVEQSAAYLNQLRLDISDLDVTRFKAAWQQVVDRHDALRTGFISTTQQNFQYVIQDHQIAFDELDWRVESGQSTDELARTILETGFAVTEEVGLMSFTLVQQSAQQHHFIWTYHHMLLDGWSSTAVLAEVMMAYQGQALPQPGGQYQNYLAYLAKQDETAGDDYWQSRLAQLNEASYLTELQSRDTLDSDLGYEQHTLQLDESQAAQLQAFAQQQEITVNTVLQGAWSLLLSRMLNKSAVCFGATTSGRPADLVGSDSTVGLFINTLPVISTLDNEQVIGQWLKTCQKDSMQSREFEHTPLYQIQKLADGQVSFDQQGLFDSLLIFENYPISETLGANELGGAKFSLVENREETNYPLTVFVETAQGLTINFAYQGWRLSAEFVAHLANNLSRLLEALQTQVEQPLGHIQLLDEATQAEVKKFGIGTTETLPNSDALAMFEAQAKQSPLAIAVQNEQGQQLSYGALNGRANQLAQALLAAGLTTEMPVAISMTRGIDMIVAILAVSKAGGVYVPIAVELPEERRDYICQHSGAKFVLTNFEVSFAEDVTCLNVTDLPLTSYDDGNLNAQRHHHQLVYTLYTSGSTGLPKGVAISHGNLVNFLLGMQQQLGLNSALNALALTSLSFDISGLEIYLPLISGGTVTVAQNAATLSAALLAEQDLIQATPAGWRSLLELDLLTQVQGTRALCGGEALPAELVADLAQSGVQLWNMYGPTETTIWSSCYQVTQAPVHLGDATLNTQLYVLDNQLNLCPQQVAGELYIAGLGLARGYLSRPELSAERFVANPFADDGSRLYRTGDLVRWNQNGQLEYLGRTDHQVKIRGYRIELGDIEAQLYRCEGVSEAVVVDDNSTGTTQLVGYVSGKALDSEMITTTIAQWLPDYMVPALVMALDEMPHNSNGKIDRKALPTPQWQTETVYQAPQGAREELLCQTWQQVLDQSPIGRHDNFFALGGDSILSLQIVASMRQQGFTLSPKQVFEAPTIAQLALELIELDSEHQVSQVVRGDVPLLPIQQAYFARQPSNVNHWNQAIRLTPPMPIRLDILTDSVDMLIKHHDSLRLQYQYQDGWQQAYRDYEESHYREVVWYQKTTDGAFDADLAAAAEQAQTSLNIHNGDVLRVIYVHSESRRELILIAHHLVIDGVSWRILVDDLLRSIMQLNAGKTIALASKSHSYQSWAKEIQAYPSSNEDEFEFWQKQQCEALTLPNFVSAGDDTMQSAKTLQVTLDEEQTQALLSLAIRPYRSHIDELLLVALSVALEQWTGSKEAQVFIEGHGREPWQSQLDLSRTTGWFTTLYPVKLVSNGDLAQTIISVKEHLRALPNKGVGYGAFKYYGSAAQQQALTTDRKPQIEFNYLGQIDASNNAQFAQWQMSTTGVGSSIAAQNPLSADIAINGAVQNKALQLGITYSEACLASADMTDFKALFEQALTQVIAHCSNANMRLTPADVPLLSLSQAELDALPIAQQSVSSIYPLSAMQQGMMFHSLVEESTAYMNQLRLDIRGLDVMRFKAAWQQVVDRHEALRTGFISTPLQQLQYVVAEHQITFSELDWQLEPTKSTEHLAQSILEQGFKVTEKVGLMSFTLVQHAPLQHHFIWTYHHMLLDGWSSTAVLAEVMMAYQGQTLPKLGGQYQDYLVYLAKQEERAGDDYWQSRLAQLDEATYLTQLQGRTHLDSARGYAQHSLQLSAQQAAQLHAFAQQQEITVNTVLQGVWSLLLARMLNKSTVCFGATTSGRPADLVGSDTTVGLFINTLPVINTLDNEQTLSQFLKACQQESMHSRAFEHTPLYQIQKLAEGKVSFDQQGLFDSLFIFENYPISDTLGKNELDGASFSLVENREETNYPLTVFVETIDGITINFAYQEWRLSAELVAQLASNLENLLDVVQSQVDSPLGHIQLLDIQAQKTIQQLGVGQHQRLPNSDALAMFEMQAKQAPDAIALRNEQNDSMTYGQLECRANQLAHALLAAGLTTEMPVAVSMARGIDMIVAILAISKAGGVYVPIAVELPTMRRDYICQHSGAQLVLTNANIDFNADVTCINVAELSLDTYSKSKPNTQRHHDQLVYTLYTSGSTGLPKGVAISHGNLLNFLLGMQQQLAFEGPLHALALTSLSFDISGLEIYLPLISGGTVTVAQNATSLTPDLLAQQDLLQATPAGWRSLLTLDLLTSVKGKLALCGGEALPEELVNDLAATGVRLWNMYGPTETTIWSSCYPVDQTPVHLGEAILNTQLYVLDNQLNLCPQRVAGELYIAGSGLARGYLSRPELSAERFVANPFTTDGSRLYRTGDMVRWNDKGQLEYLGRTDHQVKIRGYRIELGDIEAQLYRCEGVNEAVVVDDNSTGATQLVGYVSGEQLDVDIITAAIGERLPDYMIPALIMVLDEMPHNSNGKIDRKALPKPQWQASTVFELPETEIEIDLATIWQSVLGVERIGRGDNFFALGGDSIKALSVISQAHKAGLNVEIPALFSTENLGELAALIDAHHGSETLPLVRQSNIYSGLSFAEQRQWFLWKLAPQSSAYHIKGAMMLEGKLDLQALQSALDYVRNTHAALRTVYSEDADAQVTQHITPMGASNYRYFDASQALDCTVWRDTFIAEPFVLTEGNLFRVALIKHHEARHELVVVMHHIISDAWSLQLIIDDFAKAYQSAFLAQPLSLSEQGLRYSDYAKWQRDWFSEEIKAKQLAYWHDALGDDLSPLRLPSDLESPLDTYQAVTEQVQLNDALKQALVDYAKANSTSVFSILMLALKVLLHRYSGQSVVRVGMPIANRHNVDTESLVGFFVNTQVITTELAGDLSLSDALKKVKAQLQGAQAHQDLPFEQLLDSLDLDRDLQQPLFQVMINHQRVDGDALLKLPQLEMSPITINAREAQFELVLNCFENSDGLSNIEFEFAKERFSPSRRAELASVLRRVLAAIVHDHTMRVAQLSLMPQAQHLQLHALAKGQAHSSAQLVVEQLNEIAKQYQSEPAVKFADMTLSYQQLAAKSNQLSHHLLEILSSEEQKVVAVRFARGIDMVIAALAVFKAGATYVPIDPSIPIERQQYIAQQSNAKLMLSDDIVTLLGDMAIETIDDTKLSDYPATPLPCVVEPKQVAYMIFTSGSTGLPKGVAVSHQALADHCYAMQQYYLYQPQDHALLFASMGFDAALEQLLMPLLHGAQLSVVDAKLTGPDTLAEYAAKEGVTVVDLPPAYLRHVSALQSVRLCIVGGEGWHQGDFKLAQNSLPQAQFVNAYGPTEAVVTPTLWIGDSQSQVNGRYVPIGQPVGNRQVFVLDSGLNLLPKGAIGELYIGGSCLAEGYINQPELTAERFVADPFSEQGGRLYRTGDLVRWDENNQLQYLGRVDDQVKIRGHRIELGEIEAQLSAVDGVEQAIVMVQNAAEQPVLVAYAATQSRTASELQAQLRDTLPDYMIPQAIEIMVQFPLNQNGKVDRKSLPQISVEQHQGEFVAPQGDLEQHIAKVWQTLLKVEKVSRHDNFFALGGDSITALRLVPRINELGDYGIEVKDIFNSQDLAALAQCVLASKQLVKRIALAPAPRAEQMPVSPAQQSLWLTDRLSSEADKAAYNIAGAVALSGALDVGALEQAFNALAVRHEILRSQFVDVDGEPRVTVLDRLDFRLAVEQVDSELSAQRLRNEFEQQSFDLSTAPLMRAKVLQLAEQRYQLLVSMHHIISDGWSIANLVQELGVFYAEQLGDDSLVAKLAPLDVQYADYASWQNARLAAEEGAQNKAFWQQQLLAAPPVSILPLHLPRPDKPSSQGDQVLFNIAPELSAQLQVLSEVHQLSLFALLKASYMTFLSQQTGQQDLVVGTDLAGREDAALEPLIGFFIKVLPVRISLKADDSFISLAKQVQQQLLAVQDHQLLTLENIAQVADVPRQSGVSPIFQQLFVMQNTPQPRWPVEGVEISEISSEGVTSKFDSAIFIETTDQGLNGNLVFKRDLYLKDKMQGMITDWLGLLATLVSQPEQLLPKPKRSGAMKKRKMAKFGKLKK
ncbi:non-ribosomal peptide synthetase [Pseudoalteromonas umbrosa]|uniref:non-ribosomal peptide synthetase n=1 Tax=Pseudoalteromonas umbrosa TaxID=3048489 RepID=UPI0024C21ADF|nr:non-ribosomal peptide synthetase [Pseudoalteromonas sp. B95]MDK1290491.1 amino acid adenylation domain-containing protein [Pseudoalteromonas sp. B95]